MDGKNVVYIHNRIVLSYSKKNDIIMFAENGYTGNYYLKLILQDLENQILHVFSR